MTLYDKLEATYGSKQAADFLVWYKDYTQQRGKYELKVAETNTTAILYYEDEDVFQPGIRLPFLLFDDIYDPTNYLSKPTLDTTVLKYSDYGAQVAVLNIANWNETNLTNWLKSVKTRSSYIMGEKHKRLSIEYQMLNEYEEPIQVGKMCVNIDARYPNNYDPAYVVVLAVKHLNKTSNSMALHIYDTPTGKWVCSLLLMWKDKEEVFVPLISMTTDEEIRKLHTTYIVGHTEAVKWAVTQKFNKINFMMYYDFKKNLNFERENRPGVVL